MAATQEGIQQSDMGYPVDARHEVWALLRKSDNGLVPCHEDDGSDSFMAWPARDQAEAGLKGQVDRGYFTEGEIDVIRLA